MVVAVKELEKAQVPAAYITLEVGILKDLQHPDIIHLLKVIKTKDKVHLVLEYVLGGNLRQHLCRTENHKLLEEEAQGIFQDIIRAVHYCPDHGIVHGDLKPHNVLINTQGHAKICDFGLGFHFLPGQEQWEVMLEGSEEEHHRLPTAPVLLLPGTLGAPPTQGDPNYRSMRSNSGGEHPIHGGSAKHGTSSQSQTWHILAQKSVQLSTEDQGHESAQVDLVLGPEPHS
ncbi:Sperm motility kinase 2B [Heterocephalus glaber]|uniref:non-specific serine/threonine protein kinase n=1 Tax=Heterocephalus glaber TaxID=10181 RepID=G5BL90_HETGA|nr:Sperm motility kinase 2B [Heterocephalus glaber]